MSQPVILVIVVALSMAFVLLALRFFNRPIKVPHAAPAGKEEEHHPFTVFGHAPLFYAAALVVVLGTWRFIAPLYFSSFNRWLVTGIAFCLLLLIWEPIYLRLQKLWAGVKGHHFHEHVSHGHSEQTTFAMLMLAAFAGWGISVGIGLLGHCNSDAFCFQSDGFWEQLVELTLRWFHCPGNWILVIAMVYRPRFTKEKNWSLIIFLTWLFLVATYIYGGYNTDPWDDVWSKTNHQVPAWLQWLFPVTFG